MYFQIGLLVLIGLGAKNAVLRVTAAVELRKAGRSIMQATIEAGEQRLRPIIMTSVAFAFGVLPLAIAVGAGANARHSIGTGILGGMIGETTLAMLYVPLFFYIFDRINERKALRTPPPPAGAPTATACTARTAGGRLMLAPQPAVTLPSQARGEGLPDHPATLRVPPLLEKEGRSTTPLLSQGSQGMCLDAWLLFRAHLPASAGCCSRGGVGRRPGVVWVRCLRQGQRGLIAEEAPSPLTPLTGEGWG